MCNLDSSEHFSTVFPDKCCEMSTQPEAIDFNVKLTEKSFWKLI